MSDAIPQFETTDSAGTTVHFSGPSAGTSAIDVPAVAGGVLSEVCIMSDPDNNPANSKIEISFDGGVAYYPLYAGGTLSWTPKGGLTQFKLKASHVGLKYFGIINREPV